MPRGQVIPEVLLTRLEQHGTTGCRCGRSDQRQFTLAILEFGQPGDVNGDGMINFEDLLILLASWGPCPGCRSDLDDDGMVGFTDLLQMLSLWT